MNTLFTVCGRAGSKGVSNKNCREFLGVPLVFYTLAAVELYYERHIGDTIHLCLNTDSDDLISQVRRWCSNINTVPRVSELAGDLSAKLPVIKDSLCKMENTHGIYYDCVVDLDISSPLRTVDNVAAAIEKQQYGSFDVVFSAAKARRSPYFNMVKQNADGSCEKVIQSEFTVRQQVPALYDMNASIYAYKPEFLRKNTSGMLFDGKCAFIVVPDTGVLDIDSEQDFIHLEAIVPFFKSHDASLSEVFDLAQKRVRLKG